MKWVPAGKKRFLFIAISLLLVVSCGVAAWYLLVRSKSGSDDAVRVTYSNLCNSDAIGAELKAKYPYFGPEEVTDMASTVDKIIKTDKYSDGENCLYILGKYYAYTGDTVGATKEFEKLLELHVKNNVWVDESIGRDSVESITARTEFYKTTAEQENNQARKGMLPDVRNLE